MGMDKQVKTAIYAALREQLSQPVSKNSQTTYVESFVKNMLAEAKKNPNSDAAKQISKVIFTDDIFEKLDREAENLILRDQEFAQYRLYKTLYSKQREVALDVAEGRKCIVCSRRAGKTELAARLLVLYAIEPNTPVLYIHTKADNAMSQCWPLIIRAAQAIELQMTKVDKQQMRIDFTNGSSIKMAANHDKSSAQFLRGGKYKLVIIDEAQSHRNMQELIDDVISPMLLDYPGSCLILQGTPPRVPHTFFEKAWKSGKWKNYHWTARDNPFVEDVDAFIDQICESKGITRENSLIKREYEGEFAYDTEAQVFANARTYAEEPKMHVDYIVIGEDFGFADYNAVIGVAVDTRAERAYVYFEWKQNMVGATEIIAATQSCYDLGMDILRRNGCGDAPHRIKIFGDNSDGTLLYEMRKRHNLPTYDAYKINKTEAIAKLAEWLAVGKYQVPENGVLTDEFQQIMYKRDDEDLITGEIDDDLYHPDAAMALLYASRFIEQLWLADKPLEVEVGSYTLYEKTAAVHKAAPEEGIGTLNVGKDENVRARSVFRGM